MMILPSFISARHGEVVQVILTKRVAILLDVIQEHPTIYLNHRLTLPALFGLASRARPARAQYYYGFDYPLLQNQKAQATYTAVP